MKDWWQR